MTKAERANAVNLTARAIEDAFKDDLKIDKEKLIYMICDKCYCSRRTAIEYILTALSRFNYEEIKEGDKYFIRQNLGNTNKTL